MDFKLLDVFQAVHSGAWGSKKPSTIRVLTAELNSYAVAPRLVQNSVGVWKSAEGRAPVAMQLVQLPQLLFFDTTDATSATGATLSTILRIFVKETSKAKGKHTCGRWMSV